MALPKKNPRHAHEMVASVARGICDNMYETAMSDNALRKAWKAKHPGMNEAALLAAFMGRFLESCLPAARATLTAMLREPYNDDLKQNIADALILDASLRNPGAPNATRH